MDPTPNERDPFYSYLSTLLHESAGELNSAAEKVAPDAPVIAPIAQTTSADPRPALPPNLASAAFIFSPEVLYLVFSLLNFAGRIRASQVCRTWRTVSLRNPSLWRDIVVSGGTTSLIKTTATLRCFELLHRSNPKPFRLVLDAPGLLDGTVTLERAVVSLMKDHAHRIASYRGPQDLAVELFRTPTTSLHTLESVSLPHPAPSAFPIPSHWGGDGAPRLRVLELGAFSFSSACRPVRALEHFSGRLVGHEPAATADLFRLFPCLQTLDLHVDDGSVLPSPPLPASLQTISILSWEEPLDTACLTPWQSGAAPRRLTVHKARTVEPVVRWFSAAYADAGACSVFLSSSELVLEAAGGADYTVALKGCTDIFASLALHLAHLERLVLEGYWLGELFAGREIICFPNVRVLQIIVRERADWPDWPDFITRAGGLALPALRRLDLAWLPLREDFDDEADMMVFLLDDLPQNLRACIMYDAPLLGRVTLTLSVEPPDCSFEDLDALAALAEEFFVIRRYDLQYDPAVYMHLQNFPAEPLIFH